MPVILAKAASIMESVVLDDGLNTLTADSVAAVHVPRYKHGFPVVEEHEFCSYRCMGHTQTDKSSTSRGGEHAGSPLFINTKATSVVRGGQTGAPQPFACLWCEALAAGSGDAVWRRMEVWAAHAVCRGRVGGAGVPVARRACV